MEEKIRRLGEIYGAMAVQARTGERVRQAIAVQAHTGEGDTMGY